MITEKLTGPDDGDQAGECSLCGPYRTEIESGKMRPCYEWEREGTKVKEVEGE